MNVRYRIRRMLEKYTPPPKKKRRKSQERRKRKRKSTALDGYERHGMPSGLRGERPGPSLSDLEIEDSDLEIEDDNQL